MLWIGNFYALLMLLCAVLSGGCAYDPNHSWKPIEKQLRKGLEIPRDIHGGLPNFESSVAFVIVKDNEPRYYVIGKNYRLQEVDLQTLEQDIPFLVYLDRKQGWEVIDLVASSVAPKNDSNFFVACEEGGESLLLRVEVRSPTDYPNHARLTVKSSGNLELAYSGAVKSFSGFEDPLLSSEITKQKNSNDGFSMFIYAEDGICVNDYLMMLGGIRLYTECEIYVERQRGNGPSREL